MLAGAPTVKGEPGIRLTYTHGHLALVAAAAANINRTKTAAHEGVLLCYTYSNDYITTRTLAAEQIYEYICALLLLLIYSPYNAVQRPEITLLLLEILDLPLDENKMYANMNSEDDMYD